MMPLTMGAGSVGPSLTALPPGAPVRGIAVGKATLVLREDGTLVTWGANPPIGRLSSLFPDPHPDSVALAPISAVDIDHDNACAASGGTGYCWGALLVKRVPSFAEQVLNPYDRALPEPVVVPEPVAHIATTRSFDLGSVANRRYRWCASTVTGGVYCWGINESGQAGNGTKDDASDPVKVEGLPGPVAQVKTTLNTTCALLTNGKVYCWGSNYYAQLGNGMVRGESLVPVEVVLP